MRTQHRLILFVLTVVLMSGTLMFQYTDNSVNEIELTRPVTDNAGYEMGGSNSDSFNRWLPERAIQDFMKKSIPQVRDQNDLSLRGSSAFNQISVNQIVDPVIVAFDATHQPLFTEVFQLQNQLSMFGVELFIMWDEFIIPEGTNVLLLSASSIDYASEEFDQIVNWFNNDGPRLLWVAGDSDFQGAFTPGSSNFLLESLGSNLRISGDAVSDDFNNDGAPHRVATQSPACEGENSCMFTEGVGSAIFHGPTSVLGYLDGSYLDLNSDPLPDVEVVMRASSDAYATDQDHSGNELDYFSTNGIVGNYPMMAIQDMSGDKYIITSGEAIFSDYQNMYGMETQQFLNGELDVWNDGFHEGQLLVDNVFTWFGVDRSMPESVMVAFDASHGPPFTSVFQLQNDLSMFGTELFIMWDEFFILDGTNVLLLAGSTMEYLPEEIDQIVNWFYSEGRHLIWVAGDSDFRLDPDPPLYTPDSSNAILEMLGSNLRISADTVEDAVNNDAAVYRVAVSAPACEGELSCTFTEGVGSAIFHGPTSVLGFADGVVLDLNTNPLPGVEVVMRASPDANPINWDASTTEMDYYSTNGIFGDYPMMAVQDMGNDKFVITSGEAVFSDYKNMYGFETEQGLNGNPDAWNGGFHEGKELVDNVLTWFGVNRDVTFDEPIYIFGNEDFVNHGFPGSGSPEDPYVIEGFSLTNPNDNLINIFDTDAYFVLRDNAINGLGSDWLWGINLYNVKNGLIENNFITGTGTGINLGHSMNNVILNNFIDGNGGGINLWGSRENTIEGNTITNNGWAAVSITNEQPIVFMRFWEDVTATVRDSIAWEASFVDPDEGLVWYYYDNLEVLLTLDGEAVLVDRGEVYFDDGLGQFRFDMPYFTEPLQIGEHEFEVHFVIDGVEEGVGFGHVTVNENAVVSMRFFEDATITEGDQIAWQATWGDTDLAALEVVVAAGVEAYLEVDGVPVEITYSDIYFDDSWELVDFDVYRYDANYLSDPLGVGEHVFDSVVVEYGVVYTFSALVTVLPISVDDNNVISNNFIGNNGQAMWMDNSNSNFVFGNTIESNWGEAISTWQSHRNVFTDNVIQTNNGWGLNIGGSDNFISNNIVRWNPMGISVHDGSNNVVSNNDIYQNWEGPGIDIWGSSDTYLTENFVYENGMGIAISESYNTQVQFNEIHDNFGDGVMINNSPLTTITDNAIFGNWGSGIMGNSDTTVSLFFLDSITVTDKDSIWWFADSSSDDPDYLQFEHDNILVELLLDGEPVWVELSEIWFDDGEGMFRYDIFHHSLPLSVGSHVFQVHFFLEGFFDLQFEAFVEVVPGESSSDDYQITGNFLDNNGWTGVNLWGINGALIDNNVFENNGGYSMTITSSSNIVMKNNYISSYSADVGLVLDDTSNSFVSNNEITGHWGSGIYIQNSWANIIENNLIYNNGGGISLEMSTDNLIQFNEIYWNWGDGVNMHNSKRNHISDNSIYENGGAGIWASSDGLNAYMRFWESLTITDQQNLNWQATSLWDDFDILLYEHDNMVVLLTVDGVPVEVERSDIWFEDEDGLYRYNIDYFSGPLPIGDHEFEVHFFLDGEELLAAIAIVTVIPGHSSLDENVFTGNYIRNNGWVGIGLDNMNSAVIDSNTIENNGDQGIWVGQSTQIEVTNNVLWSNWGDAGINFWMTTDSLISGNEIFDHFLNAIIFGQSSNNQVLSNVLYRNDGGIVIFGSTENDISFNMVSDGGFGIGFFGDSNANLISYNTVHDMWDDGMGGWNSHGNHLIFNEVYNVDDAIIFRFSNDNVIANNYLHDNRNRGIYITTEPFNPVEMSFFEDITVTDVDSIFWQATSVWDDPEYLQFEHDNMIVELTVDGELVWVDRSEIWFDEGDGLFKYDLNYFSDPLPIGDHEFRVVFTLNEGYSEELGPFVFEITAIVTVVPNEATSSGNTIHNNVITDNQGPGIQLIQADGNVISKNDITRNLGGISIIQSENNIIMKNLSSENVLSGVFLLGSTENWIYKNWLFDNGFAGITLSGDSRQNSVFKNTIFNNPSGIVLEFSSDNLISRNQITNNEWGIYLEFSNNNKVSRNDFENNYYAIYLLNSHENKLSQNDIEENFAGIVLESSNYNTISRNEIENNEYGLALIFSDNNSIRRNEIEENGVGVFSAYSYENTFKKNEIEDNGINFIVIG
ncbi:MAG: hypothetical protein HeimC2_02390 [Candidatus Heimdallarchaeota archaeon LC_2]|nr:MAG: hypothetical protein HeimC2_02390 [Candidatus Heimdallarchaeota archaeon LC_2]